LAKDVTFEPSSAIFFCRVGSTFPVLLFLLFTEIEFSRVIDLAFSEKQISRVGNDFPCKKLVLIVIAETYNGNFLRSR